MALTNKNIEKICILPSAISALTLFILLNILVPGAGSILLVSVVSIIAYPLIVVFTYCGITISNKVKIKNKLIHTAITILLGASLGSIGYIAVNSILYFQGTFLAFIISGAVAGAVVSLRSAANK